MLFETAFVSTVIEELGRRLKVARLNKNISQQEVADKVGVARRTIVEAEKGNARLDTFVAIMQVLGVADQLNLFLPEQEYSPLQIAKLKGKQRQRGTGKLPPEEGFEQW